MAVLVDTNILLRSTQTDHPHFPLVERAFAVLRADEETLHVALQNFVEFWAVATRPGPSENGLGLSIDAAAKELGLLKELFQVLAEPPSVLKEWESLVTAHKVTGKNTHDARLAAIMRSHGISKILTFNGADFRRYPGITVLDPAQF